MVVKSDEELKRLTLDLPSAVHRHFKVAAAGSGVAMADLLRVVIERLIADPPSLDEVAETARRRRNQPHDQSPKPSLRKPAAQRG